MLMRFAVRTSGLVLAAFLAVCHAGTPESDAGQCIPQVVRTGKAPTGYEVTFRYYAPDAKSIKLLGMWYFSDHAHSTAQMSAGYLPSEWKPGYFPLGGALPLEMKLDPKTGVWSQTITLPSGTYNYWFVKDCENPSGSPLQRGSCPRLADPSNVAQAGPHPLDMSVVYVPFDPKFQKDDYSIEGPAKKRGKVEFVNYTTTFSSNPPGSHPIGVYLPPGYDPKRSAPYPTLYLSHGGGGQEADWFSKGAAANILDNLIATGKVEPTVAIAITFNNTAQPGTAPPSPAGGRGMLLPAFDAVAADILTNVIPFVEAHYNVSKEAHSRAFAGLSMGGGLTNNLLYNHTTSFGYYGVLSAMPSPAAGDPAYENPDLKKVGIFQGSGLYDDATLNTRAAQTNLFRAGVPFTSAFVAAEHEWPAWRQLLAIYAADVIWKPLWTRKPVAISGPGAGGMGGRGAAPAPAAAAPGRR